LIALRSLMCITTNPCSGPLLSVEKQRRKHSFSFVVASSVFLLLALFAIYAKAADAPTTALTPFSAKTVGSSIPGWDFHRIRNVKHATQYSLVKDEEANAVVLEGVADAAAGALGVRFDGDAKETPLLRFKWKVGNLIESSNPRTKDGDDYAARIYVTFAYDASRATFKEKTENAFARALYGETPPHAALSYVFTHKAKVGDIITSPFTSRVKKIVVDADPSSVDQWKSFERNIYDDYKRAFHEEPTRISGVAIMVDTDNTGEKAKARFGDVVLGRQP
jgi:Protein of unknown function (DUF3047)